MGEINWDFDMLDETGYRIEGYKPESDKEKAKAELDAITSDLTHQFLIGNLSEEQYLEDLMEANRRYNEAVND